jgi:cytochrome P450
VPQDARYTPGSPPRASGDWPLLAHTVPFLRSPLDALERWGRADASVVAVSVAGRPVALVTDPRVARRVLVDAADDYRKAELVRDRLGTLQGGSLVLLEGDAWRERRATVGSVFTGDRVAGVDGVTARYTDAAVDDWPATGVVDLQSTTRDLALAVLARALFGLDLGDDSPIHAAADDVLTRLRLDSPSTYLPEWVPTPTNRRFQRAVATLHARLDKTVESRRDTTVDDRRGTSEVTGVDPDMEAGGLLGALAAAGLPTETIRDELIAFLFAGFDSTATALSCTLGSLAANPEVQASLAAAVDDTADGALADAPLGECALLDAVVKESLRLYPPQYLLFREPLTDVSLAGFRLPAGQPVVLAPWLYHRDGRFWDDPETFRPRRWLDDADETADDSPDRPDSAYLPYGVGPRRCVGRQMADRLLRTAVAAVCRRRRLRPVDTLTVSAGPTLALDGGLAVRVDSRE